METHKKALLRPLAEGHQISRVESLRGMVGGSKSTYRIPKHSTILLIKEDDKKT
jgi:hypothetical protein